MSQCKGGQPTDTETDMKFKSLSQALRNEAERLREEGVTTETRESSRYLDVLARIVENILTIEEVYRVFGAPGDWGYSHPIGEALHKIYSGHE